MNKAPHLDPLRAELRGLAITQPPQPWRKVCHVAVGGLRAVGFDRESDLLLVVSFTGRGVIDCVAGQKIARDDDESYFEDTRYLEAEGIGPLKGKKVRIAGSQGGGLPTSTEDGWSMEMIAREWPEQEILILEPYATLFDFLQSKPSRFHKVAAESELRACGFSYTGKTMIVATSSDVLVFGRN